MSFPIMESLPDSRLNSVGIARRKKFMNQNKIIGFFYLRDSLIQPISLSPAVLSKVIFNVNYLKLQKGVKKSMGRRNDDRSNSMNPNNSACHASYDNRSNQLNSNNSEYKGDSSNEEEE